jgi:Zn-dependent protease
MIIKEIHAKAGRLPGYLGYFSLVFVWYFLDNTFTSIRDVASESSMRALLDWGFTMLIVPLISAGLFGGIHAQQQVPDTSSAGAFFSGVKKYYWRILAANLLFLIVYTIAVLALAIAGLDQTDSTENRPLLVFITSPFSAILLFWYAAIVVERSLFGGLLRALKTLLFHPYALLIGIAWAALSATDTAFFDVPGNQASLALNGIRAVVLAAARILAIVYALAVYKQARGEAPEAVAQETAPLEDPATSSGDEWVRAGFVFAFLAFLPLVHLLALACGIIALWRKKRFVFSAAIACCVGGFFTVFYFLALAGWVVNYASPATGPGYAFLAEANPGMEQQVALLEQGSAEEIQTQLERNMANGPARHWALDSFSALAKYGDGDLDGALADFQAAAAKKPERSEFYYYYGLALLDNDQTEMATGQFQAARAHAPELKATDRYLELIDTIYEPSTITSAMLSILILIILFALHEYGHAYAAWKLGDDTAKNLGRLTLNPIAHLDLFGSIILPGILLLQQSGIIFGWAKPVPVNPENFQNPKRDHMLVAFAGPAVNFIISIVCFVILGFLMLLVRLLWPGTLSLNLADPFSSVSVAGPPLAQWIVYMIIILKHTFYVSLLLGCFNLIPIPPLDGSWILSGLLPEKLSVLFEKTRSYGFLIFFLLVITPAFDYVMAIPLGAAYVGLQILVTVMGLG